MIYKIEKFLLYPVMQAGQEKMWNPGMTFPGNLASSREIFANVLKKSEKICDGFVANQKSSYVKPKPTH